MQVEVAAGPSSDHLLAAPAFHFIGYSGQEHMPSPSSLGAW